MDLEQVVEEVGRLEAQWASGELSREEYWRRAWELWQGWLHGPGPEAQVLREVLAAVQEPGYEARVQDIWGRWLDRIRREEGD